MIQVVLVVYTFSAQRYNDQCNNVGCCRGTGIVVASHDVYDFYPHCFIVSPFHRFTVSPFHRFTVSLFHCFTVSLFHRFTVSPFHCFADGCSIWTGTLKLPWPRWTRNHNTAVGRPGTCLGPPRPRKTAKRTTSMAEPLAPST
jgi:hypothetical protein